MTDHILELSTQVEPAKTFTVDDEEYTLLGLEHLSEEDEARATAAFTRFGQIAARLDEAKNDDDAKKLAANLRGRRIKLITMLTTIPAEIATKLPISAQASLFTAIRKEAGQEGDIGDDIDTSDLE